MDRIKYYRYYLRLFFLFVFTTIIFSCPNLEAQENATREEQAILEVFNHFFESMHNRDTVTLKRIIRPIGFFFSTMNNDSASNTIKSISSSNLKGFIKAVGKPDGRWGNCNNKFSNIDVQFYDGFSIITADYKCYVVEDIIENCG